MVFLYWIIGIEFICPFCFFSFRFSLSVCWAFFRCSLLPVSLLPLSAMFITPFNALSSQPSIGSPGACPALRNSSPAKNRLVIAPGGRDAPAGWTGGRRCGTPLILHERPSKQKPPIVTTIKPPVRTAPVPRLCTVEPGQPALASALAKQE
jgi:hypothetical protein